MFKFIKKIFDDFKEWNANYCSHIDAPGWNHDRTIRQLRCVKCGRLLEQLVVNHRLVWIEVEEVVEDDTKTIRKV